MHYCQSVRWPTKMEQLLRPTSYGLPMPTAANAHHDAGARKPSDTADDALPQWPMAPAVVEVETSRADASSAARRTPTCSTAGVESGSRCYHHCGECARREGDGVGSAAAAVAVVDAAVDAVAEGSPGPRRRTRSADGDVDDDAGDGIR